MCFRKNKSDSFASNRNDLLIHATFLPKLPNSFERMMTWVDVQPALLLSSVSEIICHSEQLGAFLPWESDTRSSSRQIAMLNVEVGFE